MFSSSSNGGISHFSQVSPYLNRNPSASSTFCLNDNQALLYHHHQDLLPYCFTVAPVIETANKLATVSTQKATTESNTNTNPQISISSSVYGDQRCLPILHTRCWPRKHPVTRDRHSKIFTSQGPRDRRVRLSIAISRKFFGLQDLLGFDKASLTLDWLLTKSKTAIKELLQTKQADDANVMCLCSSSEEEDTNTGTTEQAGNGGSKKTTCSKRNRKPVKQKGVKKPKMTVLDKLAKELRAKARERARERTREKNSLTKHSQEQKLPDLLSINPNSQSWWTRNQIGTCKFSDFNRQSTMSCLNEYSTPLEAFNFFANPRTGKVNTEEMFQDSVRIKRQTKPSSNFAFHRNLSALKEGNSDFSNWPPVTNDML